MTIERRRSLLCPNCRKLISFDEAKCPHCGLDRPGAPVRHALWTRAFGDPSRFLRSLVYLNAGMFALSLLLNLRELHLSMSPFGFLSPAQNSLLLLGATGRYAIDQIVITVTGIEAVDRLLRWSTLLTANYLHGSLLHIVFNMIAFMQIGSLAIREYGTHRTFLIYTLGGVFGFLLSYIAGIWSTIGASGAVCALIGAMLYFGKSRGGDYGDAVFRQIGGWAIGLFLFGLLPGINNWAHGGGMAAGALLGFLTGYNERKRPTPTQKWLASLCAIATLLLLTFFALFGVLFMIFH